MENNKTMRSTARFLFIVALANFYQCGSANVQADDEKCLIVSQFEKGTTSFGSDQSHNIFGVLGKPKTKINEVQTVASELKREHIARQTFSFTTAALLAMDHFNRRDESVVPKLAEILKECHVYFPPLQSIAKSSRKINDPEPLARTSITNAVVPNNLQESSPCAILGSLNPDSAWESELRASAHATTTVESLDDARRSHTTVHGSDSGYTLSADFPTVDKAKALIQYLIQPGLDRDSIAVIHSMNSATMESSMSTMLKRHGQKVGIRVTSFSFKDEIEATSKLQWDTIMEEVMQSGIKTILFDTGDVGGIPVLAQSLSQFDMLGDDFMYYFSSHVLPTEMISALPRYDTNVDALVETFLAGAFVLDRMDKFQVPSTVDPFLEAWQTLGWTDAVRTKSHLQHLPDGAYSSNFQTKLPMTGSSFIFDSVIAVGIGACRSRENAIAESERVVASISRETIFQGASGDVSFKEEDRRFVRSSGQATMGLFNIRRDSNDGSIAPFHALLATYWTESAGWTNVSEVQTVYRGGSMTPPASVGTKNSSDYHGIAGWAKTICFGFLGFSSIVLLMVALRLAYSRGNTIIRRSQPFYLGLVCLSSFVTSLTVLAISADEGAGWEGTHLDIACSITPFLFFTGQVWAASALFTKTWRIYAVLKYRERSISESTGSMQMATPLFLTCCVLVAWYARDPLSWTTETNAEVGFEMNGECHGQYSEIYFGVLAFITLYLDCFTLLFAWRTQRGVPDSFRDHGVIIRAMSIQLLTWVSGITFYLLTRASMSSTAIFLCKASGIFILSFSNVVIVILPKLFRASRRTGKSKLLSGMFGIESSDNGTGTNTGSTQLTEVDGTKFCLSVEQGDAYGIVYGESSPFKGIRSDRDSGMDTLSKEQLAPMSMVMMDSVPPPISVIDDLMYVLEI